METYDYIVIGAGSAGCVVARRLSDDPGVRVLLLESGPPADDFWIRTPAGMGMLFGDERFNWSYFTEPISTMKDRKLYWARGKTLGGSSAINGMVYIRGHRMDYDHWRDQGNAGWGYDELLPFFKKMEHNSRGADEFRGADGPLWISDPVIRHPTSVDFIEAAVRTGIPRSDDLNGAVHDGVGFVQHNIRNGKRQSAYVAFVQPVRDRRNLVVETGASVRRIVFEGRAASGVVVATNGRERTVRAAREVVVCAGALNSPHLLMVSGIGDAGELQAHGVQPLLDLPGVGKNLQDHFSTHSHFRTTPASSYNRELSGLHKYWQGFKYLVTRKGYLALGSSQAVAFVKSRPEEAYADVQISFRPMTHQFLPDGRVVADSYPAISASIFGLRPVSRGHVSLNSADPTQAPAFVPNYLTHPDDVRAMLSGLRWIRRIMTAQPIAARVVEEILPGPRAQTDEQLIEVLRERGNCAFHPVGTCKMGQDRMAVVDDRLRVHGVERLRVIDASIMPTVTSGNTNAPSMMIGEKGAEMMRQDAAGSGRG